MKNYSISYMRTLVKYFVLLAVVSISVFSKAQDQAVYNNYIANQGILNPAYNGTRDFISGLLVFRSQWTGFKGAPYTGALNVHSPINAVKNLGAGIVIAEDHLGFTNQLEVFAAGSYRLKIDKSNTLALGLQVGFKNIVYDATQAIVTDYGDPVFEGKVSTFGFNFGFGGYLYAKNYFAGLSIPRFFTTKYNSNKQKIKNAVSMQDLHIFAYGGYIFEINDIMIKPTGLFRIVPGAPLEIDVTGMVMPFKLKGDQSLWLGLSYRTVSELVLLAEYGINKSWTIRYSFDYSLSDIRRYAVAGSHEIGVQFDFTTKKRPGMRSIRYF